MPYAIEFKSKVTGEIGMGPILIKTIDVKNKPVKKRKMTKREAEEVAEMANIDPTFKNAIHTAVYT